MSVEERSPGLPRGAARRTVDLVAASLLIAVTSPLLVAGALAVLITSGRPVLFGHRRLGRGGRRFRCWKLRTMAVDAERRLDERPELRRRYIENGYKLATPDDPRVTRVGRWLRRSYVDELPQLFNVFAGTMSLIGPRPIVPEELAEFGEDRDTLLWVKPGIFGEWTSRGPDRPVYPERARLELDYVRHRTLGRELRILARSIPVVLRGEPPP